MLVLVTHDGIVGKTLSVRASNKQFLGKTSFLWWNSTLLVCFVRPASFSIKSCVCTKAEHTVLACGPYFCTRSHCWRTQSCGKFCFPLSLKIHRWLSAVRLFITSLLFVPWYCKNAINLLQNVLCNLAIQHPSSKFLCISPQKRKSVVNCARDSKIKPDEDLNKYIHTCIHLYLLLCFRWTFFLQTPFSKVFPAFNTDVLWE